LLRQWSVTIVCVLVCAVSQAAPGRIDGSLPVVYLTFDDGPSRDGVTEQILDVLDRFEAKATFFVTGPRARANPEKIALISSAGHAIGNHTHSHSVLTTLVDEKVAEEFSTTSHHVLSAGGPAMSCFRAPFGATNPRVNNVARQMGLQSVSWTIDTRDWDTYTDREHIAVQLEDSRHGSVVLMHDGPNFRWRTLEVFTQWMEDVGHLYSFEVVPECVKPAEEMYASIQSLPEAELLPLAPVPPGQSEEPPLSKNKTVPAARKVSKPAPVTQVVVKPPQATTIPQLLAKLRNYKIDLQPEVLAHSLIKN